jgi:hypothetical protein
VPTPSTTNAPNRVRSARERDAVQLAAGLRGARVSLLSGPPRCGKSTLLLTGVLPLLRRRAADHRGALPGAAIALLFPDRRRRADAPWAAPPEVVVYVDAWGEDPLAGLIGRIQVTLGLSRVVDQLDETALSDSLVVWGRQLGARVLVILDQFEHVLQRDGRREEVVRLHRALRRAVMEPALPANFLLALRDDAEGGLAAWRRELPGFDRQHVRLGIASVSENGLRTESRCEVVRGDRR